MGVLATYHRKWQAMKWPPRVYLILVVLNMLFQLVSAIALMVLPDYCGVNICAREFTVNKGVLQIVFVVFQIWNVFDGLFNDNLYEIYAAMLTSVFLTLYGILKFVNHGVHKDAFDYIMIVEEVVYQVSNIALIAPLYKEYTWRLSKKLGVDKNVRIMFRDYLIAMTLLKFDIMFSVLNVLSSGYGLFNTGGLLALDIIMIVLSLVYAVLGWQGHRRENKILLIAYFILAPAMPAYIIFYFTKIQPEYFDWDIFPELYFLQIVFICTAILSLILRAAQLYYDIILFKNMGTGLKTILFRHANSRKDKRLTDEMAGDQDAELDVDFEDELNVDDVIANTYVMNPGTRGGSSHIPYIHMEDD